MDINKIPVGKNAPHDCNVLIEVPIGSSPVKYELDKDSGALFVDRFLHTAMHYPCNYGFIPHTLSDDGDPIDVMIVSRRPILPGAVVAARPIGVLVMEDEKGEDEKILAVPSDRLHPYYKDIKRYDELPEILLEQITHFFEHYKDLEKDKWVKVKHWGDDVEARRMIEDSIARANRTSSAA